MNRRARIPKSQPRNRRLEPEKLPHTAVPPVSVKASGPPKRDREQQALLLTLTYNVKHGKTELHVCIAGPAGFLSLFDHMPVVLAKVASKFLNRAQCRRAMRIRQA